jgi:hypothetical protein
MSPHRSHDVSENSIAFPTYQSRHPWRFPSTRTAICKSFASLRRDDLTISGRLTGRPTRIGNATTDESDRAVRERRVDTGR